MSVYQEMFLFTEEYFDRLIRGIDYELWQKANAEEWNDD